MKVVLAKYWVPIAAGLIILGLLLGFAVNTGVRNIFGIGQESHNTQVVHSLDREEEVVLLSLGIQGIDERRETRQAFGQDIPGTGRTLFLQYNYRAKLGLDGQEVVLEEKGEDVLLVRIPEFKFIGHDQVEFKTALEDNGLISWVTPDIDTPDLITELLNDDVMYQHVNDNRDLLEEQARVFYTGIIHSVDPEIEIIFEFADPTRAD